MIEEEYDPRCKCGHMLWEHTTYLTDDTWAQERNMGCWLEGHEDQKHPCAIFWGFPRKYCPCGDFKLDSLNYLEWKYANRNKSNERG